MQITKVIHWITKNLFSIITFIISLYSLFHKPKVKLKIVTQTIKYNYIESNNMNQSKHVIQFCLLSNTTGRFQLEKLKYKFNAYKKQKYKIIYDINKNINNIDNNDIAQLLSMIFVTPNKPSRNICLNYNKMQETKKRLETDSMAKNGTIVINDMNITPGKLICYFKTNDNKNKVISCKI